MRKIIFTLILSLALILSTSMAAFAGDISTNGGSDTVEVMGYFEQGYTVTIPDTVVFGNKKTTDTKSVSANNVLLEDNNILRVTVSSKNNWEIWNESEFVIHGLKYEAKVAGNSGTILDNDDNNEVLVIRSGETDRTVNIVFTLLGTPTKAGLFTDTLTFKVEVSPE